VRARALHACARSARAPALIPSRPRRRTRWMPGAARSRRSSVTAALCRPEACVAQRRDGRLRRSRAGAAPARAATCDANILCAEAHQTARAGVRCARRQARARHKKGRAAALSWRLHDGPVVPAVTARAPPRRSCVRMAITASVTAPAGDAPVRFPNTRAAKQQPLQKQTERPGGENNSSALQARARAWAAAAAAPCRACLRLALLQRAPVDAPVPAPFLRLLLQVAFVTTYLLVKWTWSWWQSRKSKKSAPPAAE
jgi:hypothetical protein